MGFGLGASGLRIRAWGFGALGFRLEAWGLRLGAWGLRLGALDFVLQGLAWGLGLIVSLDKTKAFPSPREGGARTQCITEGQ